MKVAVAVLVAVMLTLPGGVFADTIVGGLEAYGGKVSMTTDPAPVPPSAAVVHVKNSGDQAIGLRVESHWTASGGAQFQNDDSILSTVNNTVTESGLNRSWAGSFANGYNYIPYGVTDLGERVGLYGWAVSITQPGFLHAGTLNEQVGVKGRAGFQGSGELASSPTAVINNAIGVRGEIIHDSPGATILSAHAGEFISAPNVHNIVNNVAVYALALSGTETNYSFYSPYGELFNSDRAFFGSLTSQSGASISARKAGNSIEFGHVDVNGYGSTLGATYTYGFPFLSFSAEADPTGDTFRTRGKAGVVISSDLAGSLVFSRLANPNATGQAPIESARFNARGNIVLSRNPPASSTSACTAGEHAWDENYTYVCVAANTWKRAALSSW